MQSGRLVGMVMVAMWLMVHTESTRSTKGTAYVAYRRKVEFFVNITE
jgi:hypothetical protein